ncbi:MAG: LacI family transcriptional regulator, partial [Nocardiopsaceae bacterium]|nr:LacI family transcriptional regulator [Nocardiopsaceae bacterium]
MRDVAEASCVSVSTVSRALSSPGMVADSTRVAVQAAAERLGYRRGRGMARPTRHGRIGMVIPDLENPFFGAIGKAAQARARAGGFSVYIADTDDDPSLEGQVVASMTEQVDGVLMCWPRGADAEIESLAQTTPMVLVNRQVPGVPSITFDNAGGLRYALDHLIALGHRAVAYAGGPAGSWANQQRRLAFLAFGEDKPGLELIELGNFPPYFSGGVLAGDLAVASGATAVIAFDDVMALGVLERLRQRGLRVPADMSVAGFDNTAVSEYVWPNLTTVDFPRARIGRSSVELLLSDPLTAPSIASGESSVLPGHLVVRQSTGPAPAAEAPDAPAGGTTSTKHVPYSTPTAGRKQRQQAGIRRRADKGS